MPEPLTSAQKPDGISSGRRQRNLWLSGLLIAAVLALFADMSLSTQDPQQELWRLVQGFFSPSLAAVEDLPHAVSLTIAFALIGTAAGAVLGGALALVYTAPMIRSLCAVVRAVHEVFWALIFMQVFGLSAITGVLAIALPYACIFAKIYHELLQTTDDTPEKALPAASSRASRILYARLPQIWHALASYTRYRFECALRTSAILGFIGLPTLGFYLDTAFKQGQYAEGAGILLLFFAVIATIRFWLRPVLVPVYLGFAIWLLPGSPDISWELLWRFVSQDIVPSPLRAGSLLDSSTWLALGDWLQARWHLEIAPALWPTLQLTFLAMIASALVALLTFWLINQHLVHRLLRPVGHLLLLVFRSTPELLLAYIFLLVTGPSMLPALIALALHNGALIGYLMGRFSNRIEMRVDSCRGLNHYAYELLPSISPPLQGFLLYRAEVILRETAMVGILGIATLGFYIDSAFEMFRFDRALLLILCSAALNLLIDRASGWLSQRFKLTEVAHC